MITYEVNLEVDHEITEAFRSWLPEHIKQVLSNKGFCSAQWWCRNAEDEGGSPDNKTLWTIHYAIEDRACLNAYLEHQAPKMRQATLEQFGDGFSAKRRILELLTSFSNP